MHRFWGIIEPILKDNDVKKIVEIRSERSINTQNLLAYCKSNNGTMVTIDPEFDDQIVSLEKENKEYLTFYPDMSLSALPLIKSYDAIFLDGDRNWYTVYNELKIIEKSVELNGNTPIVFIHDTQWPYARRDSYLNPENIPLAFRQAYKKSGVLPGKSALVDSGYNNNLQHSIYENNPRNGVLAAVEDFLKETKEKNQFFLLSGFHGLGILIFGSAEISLENQQHYQMKLIKSLEHERIVQMINIDNLQDNLASLQSSKNEVESEYFRIKNQLEEIREQYERVTNDYENRVKILKNELEDNKNRAKSENSEIKHVQLKESEIKLDKLEKEMNLLVSKNEQLLLNLKRAEISAATHLNSMRYRLGDIIISGLRPSKKTLLMPLKIGKLFYQHLKQKNVKPKKVLKSHSSAELNYQTQKLEGRKIKEKNRVLKNPEELRQSIITRQEKLELTLPKETPLVSIIVINRNGSDHLNRLLKKVCKYNEYSNIEFIIVDNNSNDNSIEVIEKFKRDFSISVINNDYNASFSQANNQAAKVARGEYLLLLNNDIEPLKGWLSELVNCMLENPLAGTIGSKLVYSLQPNDSINKELELLIQHTGIAFKKLSNNFIQPYNTGKGLEVHDPESMIRRERATLTAACLLVKKELYIELGGLDEGYIYGYEDVDFGLKVLSKGFKNIYCPTSVLFHHEFGTQQNDTNHEVRERRLSNQRLIKEKWHKWLDKSMWLDKINNYNILSEKKLKVSLIVTEMGDEVTAGDYFTALELGMSMEKLGWDVEYVPRKGKRNWYEIDESVDIVISLLDAYDPSKIISGNNCLIKVAWMRNWFERWIEQPNFEKYDILMASSKIACNLVSEKTGRLVYLLPIATNSDRFNIGQKYNEYDCDYCFTGSYWNDERDIIGHLDPERVNYRFHVYGKNWEKVRKFKPYHKGFIQYKKIPDLYKSTKIVIDDANRVTKPYGAVNSRVFDALGAGTLVLTNGYLGSQDTFEGKLPVYSSAQELEELLNYYLSNETARVEKVKELQKMVLNHHTYDHRAGEFRDILLEHISNYRVAIKIAAPKWESVHEWGDYHMAMGLKKEFEKKGHQVLIQLLYEWDNGDDENCDVVIVLRGLNAYTPKNHHINILWNISHPDEVTVDEMNRYDYVCISSKYWSERVSKLVSVPVETMLQCTDTNQFRKPEIQEHYSQILFVGNSRKVFRKILKDLLPTEYDLHVYGTLWDGLIDKKYIKGNHISNSELYKHYGSCEILLNDHWDDMRDKGFISNRIFDALATESFIITDKVRGIEEEFGDSVATYDTPEELRNLIDFYLKNPNLRKEKAKKGSSIVRERHSYEQRVERFLEIFEQIN
ncbi:glycosyltransferase [Paenibacillus sp. 7516]|uniref:glycosyltransferase family protein n=1 Tax=Paenibacillus sp. 7516 TaxID=2022549 RepID=UPI000BA7DA61|nr:glycosyltransferase [Paenibacillus sp. 7516]PAF29464.1 hypothetical protein CHI14_22485 [Paenibacillus sp. 7516]